MPVACPIFPLSTASYLSDLSAFEIQGSPDLKAAREVADYLGTRHHEFYFTVQVILYKNSIWFFAQLY